MLTNHTETALPGHAMGLARLPLDKQEGFERAEANFESLLTLKNLDALVDAKPALAQAFMTGLDRALLGAYGFEQGDDRCHLFLQRTLYRINRMKLFWFDGFDNYLNEDSVYLDSIRRRIEQEWSQWELLQLGALIPESDVQSALKARAAADVAPPMSSTGIYFRDEMGFAGYRRLLQISSLDGLVEASQLSRTLGGVGNPIHSMMTRLLVEEYGGGRLNRKHSTYFVHMLNELNLDDTPEAYFDLVPWEVLATINHSFLLSERKTYYLRYVGGLLHTEISVPAAFDGYRLAAERLGMSEKARGYWNLHIREDERHGQWMLNDVALPLAEMYPGRAGELILGYDQQKFMSDRAGRAVARAARRADRKANLSQSASIGDRLLGRAGAWGTAA